MVVSLLIFVTHRNKLLTFFFFFNHTPSAEIYTLSLHDALPIFAASRGWVGKVLRVAMSGLLSCKSIHKGPTPIGHGGDMWSDISTVRFPQRDSNTMNRAEWARHGIRKTAERRWPRRPGPYLHFSFEEID